MAASRSARTTSSASDGCGQDPEQIVAMPGTRCKYTIGEEIRTVQFGWPLGMPLVRKLDVDLSEVRVRLKAGGD